MALLLGGGGGGASGLSWESTTQGVTIEGLNAVLDDVKLEMVEKATENLNNTSKLVEAIQSGWSGTDCDMWLQNFDSLRQEIVDSLEFYYNQIEVEFQKVFSAWEEFQSSNVTQG